MFQVDKAYYASRVSFIYLIRDDSAMQGYKSYSRTQYESHTVLRKFLLPIAQKDKDIRRYINFFLIVLLYIEFALLLEIRFEEP